MCRDKSCGGRRCPGDTADARRARRYAAHAAASADPTQVASSVRADGAGAATVAEPEQITAESLRAESEQYRDLARRMEAVDAEFQDMLRNDYERLATDGGTALAAKHGIPSDALRYRGTDDSQPVLDYERYEAAVRRIGAKTDQWLDRELAPEREAFEDAAQRAADSMAAWNGGAAARAEELRDLSDRARAARAAGDDGEANRLLTQHRDATSAHWAQHREALGAGDDATAARDRYYDRKRELLAQLRPTGARLEWTTGGVRTPAKTKAEVDDAIQHASSMLPADWIEESNRIVTDSEYAELVNAERRKAGLREVKPVRVYKSRDRNHYRWSGGKGKTVEVQKTHFVSHTTGGSQEDLEAEIASTAQYELVPDDELTAADREQLDSRSGATAKVRAYTVGRPGSRYVDYDGTLKVTGKAAAQWEEVYDPRYREYVWRRPMTEKRTVGGKIAEITIPMDDPRNSSVTVHELTHRCENVNLTLGKLEGAFVERRTTNPDGTRQAVEAYQISHPNEMVRPDEFVNRYIGKDYGNSNQSHEVLSMGHEIALKGAYGGFGKLHDPRMSDKQRDQVRDDDHHHFVLGTWLSA